MTSLRRNRIHGWIVPAIIALAVALALGMPGLARADDASPSTAATPVTTTIAGGTSDSPANSVVTPATSSTDTTTSITDDTSATDSTATTDSTVPGAASTPAGSSDTGTTGAGGVAQPDAASWR